MYMQTQELANRLSDSWKASMIAKTKSLIARAFIYLFLILAAFVGSINLIFFVPKSLSLIPIFLAVALFIAWCDRN